eukprot:14808308-Alexandrium_andersonii.AAC.1
MCVSPCGRMCALVGTFARAFVHPRAHAFILMSTNALAPGFMHKGTCAHSVGQLWAVHRGFGAGARLG